MIHYHGTPLTPRSELQKLAGKCFCVSFANPNDAETCLRIGQAIMWDNGAFSFHTQGKPVDWAAFYKWVEPKIGGENWAVIPDVIDGGVEANDALLGEWPFPAFLSAPVWHLAEPIDRLLRLCDHKPWSRVCFGSSGAYWQVGGEAWERRADAAFNELTRRFGAHHPKIHMLRGLALCGDRWPFASADSVNVARNFKDTSTCPERMARRIDAVQCPIRWNLRATQMDLIA